MELEYLKKKAYGPRSMCPTNPVFEAEGKTKIFSDDTKTKRICHWQMCTIKNKKENSSEEGK